MLGHPFVLDNLLKVLILCPVKLALLPQSRGLNFDIVDLLSHILLVLLKLGTLSLQTFLVALTVDGHGLMVVNFNFKLVSFFFDLTHGLVS